MACKLPDLFQGNSMTLTDTISADGVPVDITGDTVILTVKKNPNDATAALTITNTTHSDPTNGKTTFTIAKAMSILFEIKTHYVDITWIRVSPAGTYTVFNGVLPVIKPVRTPA